MGKILTVTDAGLPLIPEGEYRARFSSYEEKKGLAYGDALRVNFEVETDDLKGTIVNTLVSQKLSPQSRLGAIVRALTRKPLKVKDGVDLDNLVGKHCLIVVKTVAGKATYGDFSTVTEVKPVSKNDLPF